MKYESDIDDNGLEATTWRIIRASTLRALLHGTGRTPESMDEDEQNAALEPLLKAMEHDLEQHMMVVTQGRRDAVARMQHSLHDAPGLDHEMVDQAIEYATKPDDGGWSEL